MGNEIGSRETGYERRILDVPMRYGLLAKTRAFRERQLPTDVL